MRSINSIHRQTNIAASIVACLLVIASSFNALLAQSGPDHSVVKTYLDSETSFVVWLDIGKADINAALESIQAPGPATEVNRIIDKLKAAHVDRAYLIGSISALMGLDTQTAMIVPSSKPEDVASAIRNEPEMQPFRYRATSNALVIAANDDAIDFVVKLDGKPSEHLLQAVESCSGTQGIAVAIPKSVVSSFLTYCPKEVLDGEYGPLIKSLSTLSWLSESGDLPPASQTVRAKFENADAANKTTEMVNALISQRFKEKLPFKIDGDRASVVLSTKTPFIEQLLGQARAQSQAAEEVNALKQIALALYNFESVHQTYPPQALTNNEGRKLLSWRVLLLPYLDQKELYDQFHLDEAWDSPHNLTLLKKIPDVYKSRRKAVLKEGYTRYVCPLDKTTLMGRPGLPVKISDIEDGTSVTIWLVESDEQHAVPWTKPVDLVIDPKNPLAGIELDETGRFAASILDGSARTLPGKMKAEHANALFSINGGEIINFDEIDSQP